MSGRELQSIFIFVYWEESFRKVFVRSLLSIFLNLTIQITARFRGKICLLNILFFQIINEALDNNSSDNLAFYTDCNAVWPCSPIRIAKENGRWRLPPWNAASLSERYVCTYRKCLFRQSQYYKWINPRLFWVLFFFVSLSTIWWTPWSYTIPTSSLITWKF